MDRYLAERERLLASDAPGLHSARLLARLTDKVLVRLATESPSPPSAPWSLIALGGYGAGALLPSSDIDVLVLSDASERELKPFVESLLYPLWDAGFAVGHQVRSPKAHRAAVRGDISVLTATLTGRVVAGDAGFGSSLLSRCLRDTHSRSRRVLGELSQRARPGSPYLLEPDLKEGAGGRRDYDELVWASAVITGTRQETPWALADAGILSPTELGLAETAAALVAAARWELGTRGLGSRLTLDAAASIDVDAQSIQDALADTAHVLERARRRLASPKRETSPPLEPEAPLSADAVFALLRTGDPGAHALTEAAWLGRLEALVPGFRPLLTLRRPGLTHTLTVGAHSIRCAALAATLSADDGTALARSRNTVVDDRPLLVAALAHDCGKSRPGPGHAERGATRAPEIAWLFGLDERAQRDAGDLVRLHLVLAESATHDDLDSEDAILRTAERIGRRELVAPLHLLTVADGLASGPGAWGPWQDALVATLVSRVDAALSPEVDGAGLARRADEVRSAAISLLRTDSPQAARDFVARAPIRYLASREAAQVTEHAALAAGVTARGGAAAASIAVRPGPVSSTFEVTVAARNRPELFARIAGALTLAGLDILAAEAFGAEGGAAVDVFTVRPATLADVEHSTWQRFERYLHAALADRLDLESRLAERGRHYDSGELRLGTSVRIDTSAGYDTTVHVTAPDRVGLLYAIARAIASEGLDIRWAKILTSAGIARDTFHVVGPDGSAPTDAGTLGHIAMRIRESA